MKPTLLTICLCLGITMPVNADPLPEYKSDANADRSTIPDIYKWNLTPLAQNPEVWESKRVELEKRFTELAAFKGTLSDPVQLAKCLELYFDLHEQTNYVTLYANLQITTAQTDTVAQEMHQKSLSLMDELMTTASFIRAEILAIPDKNLAKAYKKVPALQQYQNYIGNLRRRLPSLLNEEGERVLSLVGDNLWAEIDLNEIPSSSEDAFNALLTDIPWPKIIVEGEETQLTLSNYGKYRRHKNPEVRKAAVDAILGALYQYRHVFAATLGGQAEFDVILARARNYPTARAAYMGKDNVDEAVYDNLITTVNANLEPLHKYIALAAKVQGMDKMHLYDVYVPFVPDAPEKEYTYDEATKIILEALKPLGEEYITVLKEGMDPNSGWLDLYPSNDKDSGAFSASAYGTHPYVMMNYQETLNDVSTLAHEYGHAMHSYLSMKNQPAYDSKYVPFLAEIASTANEALLTNYLLANGEDDLTRATILVDRANTIRGTIYRQAQFAEFELAVHQFAEAGTPITADLLSSTYADLVQRYYGSAYELGEFDHMEWAYIPHFYWKYYVYTYATGLSSGIAIADLVQKSPENKDAYLKMLSAGCSQPPLEILRGAGVDLTEPKAIEAALKLFDETVTELEQVLERLEQAKQTPENPGDNL